MSLKSPYGNNESKIMKEIDTRNSMQMRSLLNDTDLYCERWDKAN